MITPIDTQQSLLTQFADLKQIASNEVMAPTAVNDSGFASDFTQVIRGINAEQNAASELMAAVDAGRSDDLVGAMVASQKASLSFEMLLQMRNKVMNGVDDIMRMSL
ncbi:flagellar hook-basal body complex protein FliE [Rheinheimera sp.]|uniref:flagellar hook-basal body complex protein FliE n=1 Tax=Rheinheimera sp. TaxID=1869214 RepID=UPI0027BB1EF9|nr:flagellar hook-basal body complex protein FliE [Rheinheimera sp.]